MSGHEVEVQVLEAKDRDDALLFKKPEKPFPNDPCFPIVHEKSLSVDLGDQVHLRRRKMHRPQTDFGRSPHGN